MASRSPDGRPVSGWPPCLRMAARSPDGCPSQTKLVLLEFDMSSTSWIIASDVIVNNVVTSSSPPYDVKRALTSRIAGILSTSYVSWIIYLFHGLTESLLREQFLTFAMLQAPFAEYGSLW